MRVLIHEEERRVRACEHDLVAALQPFEWPVEEAGGNVPPELEGAIRSVCLDSGLFAPNFPVAWGGAGLSFEERVVLEEALGRLSGCIWAVLWRPPNVLMHSSPGQRERYVEPYCRGEFRSCYAISEPGAGTDIGNLTTTVHKNGDGWVLSGEKWFATGGDVAGVFVIVATVEIANGPAPTNFSNDRDAPGLTVGRHPRLTHHVVYGRPEFALDDVRIGPDAILGVIGGGNSPTRAWFREERVMIAARCLGAAARSIELTSAFAGDRLTFGQAIAAFQGVQWLVANSAAELAAARALTYEVAAEIESGLEPKLAHGRASVAKLFASEMAGRVTDRCVQVFGGRGCPRENPVERLWRDVRVDRIWEGTSEIQKVIIARQLATRGLDALLAGDA